MPTGQEPLQVPRQVKSVNFCSYWNNENLLFTGTFTFYSYRDPNLQSTVDTYGKCAEWVSKTDNFSDRDIIEAKLGIFQAIDRPILPGILRQFFDRRLLR